METIRLTFSPSQDVPNQLIYRLPKRLGSGSIRIDNFSSGLRLFYIDLKPTKPITLVSEMIEAAQCNFGVGFNLTGHSEIRLSTHRHSLSVKPGFNAHYVYPAPQLAEEDIGITHRVKFAVSFDTKTLLDLANEDEESFLPFLKGLQNRISVTGQDKMLPEMKRTLNQLAACPYSGRTRTLLLEGKAMELLAHKLEQIKARAKSAPRQPRINTTDIEKIHYAAELLVRDPANPPDLTDLTEKIGVSRTKFYKNFKIVFGHSPMDYLRSHRLQIGRQLLQQGRHSVTEVAFAVGFSNLSYFARAFVAEFGVLPHQVI